MGWLKLQMGNANEAAGLLEPQESLMREALATSPAWLGTFLTALGASRAATGTFAGAEPILLEAESMLQNQRPSEWRRVARELVRLYEAWDDADPGNGHARRAAEWLARVTE